MKNIFVTLLIGVALISCKKEVQYHYVEVCRDNIKMKATFDTIPFTSENDTTAYKEAVKRFYINERKTKSQDVNVIAFCLLDKNRKRVMSEIESLEDVNFKDSLETVVLKEIE